MSGARSALPVLVVAACVAGAACGRTNTPEEAAAGPIAVAIQVIQLGSLRNSINGSGTVVPAPGADWTISPPETGRIAELPKAEGAAFREGDILVKFEFANLEAEIAARTAEVQATTARLDAAKTALTRMTAMFERGYVPRNDLESARNAVVQAQSELSGAKQALDITTSSAEREVIKARFSGIVAKKFHNAGDLVNGSMADPVLRVIDPTRTQAAIQVPIQQLPLLQPGQQATILSAASPAGEAASVISRPAPDSPTATFVEARLAFLTPSTLPIDAPVQADILVAERTNVVVVPATALVKTDDGSTFVMMPGADGRAHPRDVRLGLTTRDRIEITSGLSVGDQVIVKGLDQVSEGTAITIR